MKLQKEIHKLRQLLSVIGSRGVGHTTLIKKGVENYDRKFGVIGLNSDHASQLAEGRDLAVGASMRSLSKFEDMSIPVVVDNSAWYTIISEVITLLESSMLKEDIRPIADNLMTLVEVYQERSHKIESAIVDYFVCPFWRFSEKTKIRQEIVDLIVESNNDRRLEYAFKNLGFNIK
jgi:AAA+ ATPase superfamily predicted ATPase